MKDSQPEIKHVSDERIELVGKFDANKCVLDQPSVDVATHFGIIRVQTDKMEMKVKITIILSTKYGF